MVTIVKRLSILITCLVLLLFCTSAMAAIQYLTLEELKQTQGPATVHVIAKSTEPTGKSGEYLTSKTTWRWQIKNESGRFVPVNFYVNMDWYGDMTLGERSFVLNHKECDLTIEISENGAWTGGKIRSVSMPLSKDDIGPILLGALASFAIMGYFLLIPELKNREGTRSQDAYIKKTQILAVNGIQYKTHKGAVSNAIIGHMVASDIGALVGAMSAEQIHTDNEFTFLVYYNGGKKGNKKEVEKVRQSSKRFDILVSKLEDVKE